MASRRVQNMRMASNQRAFNRAQQRPASADVKEQLYELRLVATNDRAPLTYSYSEYANDSGGRNYREINGAYRREDAESLARRFERSPLQRDFRAEIVKRDMEGISAYQSQYMADRWHDNMDSVFQNSYNRIMDSYSDEDRPQPNGGLMTNSSNT